MTSSKYKVFMAVLLIVLIAGIALLFGHGIKNMQQEEEFCMSKGGVPEEGIKSGCLIPEEDGRYKHFNIRKINGSYVLVEGYNGRS